MGNQGGKGRLSKEGSHMGQSLGREPRGSGREGRGRGREQGQAGWAEELEELGPGSEAVGQERFDPVGPRSHGRFLNKRVA